MEDITVSKVGEAYSTRYALKTQTEELNKELDYLREGEVQEIRSPALKQKFMKNFDNNVKVIEDYGLK